MLGITSSQATTWSATTVTGRLISIETLSVSAPWSNQPLRPARARAPTVAAAILLRRSRRARGRALPFGDETDAACPGAFRSRRALD
jgi:hypothetical protein